MPLRLAIRPLIILMFLVRVSSADTFRFRDGLTVPGQWLGGDGQTIRAEIRGWAELLPAAKVDAVFFGDSPPNETSAAIPSYGDDMIRMSGRTAIGVWVGGDSRTIILKDSDGQRVLHIEADKVRSLLFCGCRSSAPLSSAAPPIQPRTNPPSNDPGPARAQDAYDSPPPPLPQSTTATLRKLAKDFAYALKDGYSIRAHDLATGTRFQFACLDVTINLMRARREFDDAAIEKFGLLAVSAKASLIDTSMGIWPDDRDKIPPDDEAIMADVHGDTATLRMPAVGGFITAGFTRVSGVWKVDLDSVVHETQPGANIRLGPLRAQAAALDSSAARIREKRYRNYDEAVREYVTGLPTFTLNPVYNRDPTGVIAP